MWAGTPHTPHASPTATPPQQVPPARLTAVGQAEPRHAVPRRQQRSPQAAHPHRHPHPAAAPGAAGGTQPLWSPHPTAPGPPRPAPARPRHPPGGVVRGGTAPSPEGGLESSAHPQIVTFHQRVRLCCTPSPPKNQPQPCHSPAPLAHPWGWGARGEELGSPSLALPESGERAHRPVPRE